MILMMRAHVRTDLEKARHLLGQLPDLVHVDADHAEIAWFEAHGAKVAIKVFDLEHLSPDQRRQARRHALRSGAQLILADDPRFFEVAPAK
jgi:hypothetical protein